jgi:hypothetical protein
MPPPQSTFRGAIDFFAEIGIYDVVLPFLLVFTIVFAILEKTKVLGVEKVQNNEYTKKPLNAMVAFVVAFLVVASSRLVAAINEALARIVLLMLLSICFLMLMGTFYHHTEKVMLEGKWRKFFMILMFLGVVLIFAQAIKTDDGVGWLEMFWYYLSNNWQSSMTSSLILLVVVVGAIAFIVSEPSHTKVGEKKAE